MTGNSVAVRLPRSLAMGPDIDVVVDRVGNALWIRPAGKRPSVADMAAALLALGPVGEVEVREPYEFPERPGL